MEEKTNEHNVGQKPQNTYIPMDR